MKTVSKTNVIDAHKMMLGVERLSQLEQGFFDGSFRTRVIQNKKIYTRNIKHKNK